MELRHLRAFEAMLKTGSFTAAAAACHVSQPALWAQIKVLEAELGLVLFVRSGRGVAPTAACEALRSRLDAALRGVEAFRDIAGEIREGWAAPARIGCASSHVAHFLAGCIRELADCDPKIPFPVVVPITSATAIETLARGELDLLVEPRKKAPRRNTAALYPVYLVAIGATTTTVGTTEIAALDRVPLATLPADSLVRSMLTQATDSKRVRLRIIYESRDTHALVNLAKKGLCTAVLHDEMLDPQQARSAARIVVGRRLLSIQLHLTWRPLKQLSPAARALRNVMLRRAKERRIPGDDRVR